jgi:hypothetical protein
MRTIVCTRAEMIRRAPAPPITYAGSPFLSAIRGDCDDHERPPGST